MTITDSVNFAIKGSGCSETTLACSSVEELKDLDWDELVGLKTAYTFNQETTTEINNWWKQQQEEEVSNKVNAKI
jgi:hypothetical protein